MNVDARFEVNGALVDPTTAILSDEGGTYGVKRMDTGAVVVAAGTVLTRLSLGIYRHAFVEPAPRLSYQAAVSALIDGVWHRSMVVLQGSEDQSDLAASLDAAVFLRTGAPTAVIHDFEQEVLRDFCQKTECWKHTIGMVTVADQAEYTLEVPVLTDITRITSVMLETHAPQVYRWGPADTSITLRHAPTTSGLPLTVEVRLAPKPGRTYGPGWLVSRYRDTLVAGVVALLKNMQRPVRPWTDPDGAYKEEQKYARGIALARQHTVTNRSPQARLRIPNL